MEGDGRAQGESDDGHEGRFQEGGFHRNGYDAQAARKFQ
jgi:hypothetical protein